MIGGCAFRIAVVAIIAEFTLSANVLACFGVPYTDEGGFFIAKLHPGTYLAAAAMMARLGCNDDPSSRLGILIWRERGLALFLGCIVLCLLSAACLTGMGNLVTLLDTFLPAGMIAVALCDMNQQQITTLAHVVRSLLLLNASVAIAEAAVGVHLVPAVNAGRDQTTDFRSAGLYDHPLTGAAATMMGLLSSAELFRSAWRRRLYQAWLLTALLAFGGRIALGLTIFSGCIMLAAQLRRRALSHTLGFVDFAPLLVVGLASFPLAGAMLAAGWAERLQTHLFWDASAQARIAQFHLIGLMSSTQLMFGCRRADLLAFIEPLRLAYGVDVIENFWVLQFAALGAFGFGVFVAGMAGLVAWLWQRCNADGRIVLVSTLLVASTSNSLGRKSTLLVMLVACLIARARVPSAHSTAGVRPRVVGNFAFESQ
jgi:hypothetical protein